MKKHLIVFYLLLPAMLMAQRSSFTLQKNWKFTRDDNAAFAAAATDDSRWQSVTVPHDWAIYGPFSIHNDKQNVAITQDGQKQAMEHAGRTGGLPFVGVGWYRTQFLVPGYAPGKKVHLIFDGAMSHAQVYVNGRQAGQWPFGYNSFYLDVTPYVNASGLNTLAVRLENFVEQSRWYPGAGLYRNVHVQLTEGAHIPVWGTYITTPAIGPNFARVHMRTRVSLPQGDIPANYRLKTIIYGPDGLQAGQIETPLTDYDQNEFRQELVVINPKRWDLETPNLYKAVHTLYMQQQAVDKYETTFGIRSIEVVPDKGFFLNGRLVKFKGVCNHHDLGPLGAAVNDAAIRRQIRIMKEMGANAIRTSHNMPAPELVRAADEMGIMLMAESFDEWKIPKVRNGYNKMYDDWVEKDLVNLAHQFRNNPSVVMWCIGNEVPEQGNREYGSKRAKMMQDIMHREDPTRPVTNGMDNPDAVINSGMAAIMDVVGFNYRPFKYPLAYERLPQRLVLGSETASTVSSRGVYKFPVERKSMAQYPDHQSSSYDVEHCSWSDLPEDNFMWHEDLPYMMGEFVWTGFDYLGEPTPYYTNWPSHSSLFGIVDLAGIPKDRYYLYRSHWNSGQNTLHILPHWNWKGREGQVTPVFVYTNHPSAELFINGKSMGRRTKDTTIKVLSSGSPEDLKALTRLKRYRLMWNEVTYQPGTVRVVAYNAAGQPVETAEIKTAGKPARIVLTPDRSTLKADGADISFINVKLVDKDGNFCPTDSALIQFKVTGAGQYKAAANGNPISLESFQAPAMKLFSGQLTALAQAAETPGTITFEARTKGLPPARISIKVE